jgi:hypothetical protein
MRIVGMVILGLIGGVILGFVLSEALAIGAYLLFGGAPWLRVLRYLPVVLALAGAVVVPLIDRRVQDKSS